MRRFSLMLLCLVIVACGTPKRATPPATWIIPAGPGEWAIVDQEILLETLTKDRLVLPYGAASAGRSLKHDSDHGGAKDVVRYQVVFKPDPLAAGDRLGLELLAFQVVHADGSITEQPAHGHVIDNSDNQIGFRAALSLIHQKQLAIPAHATATVVFDQPVTVRTHESRCKN